MFSKALGLLLLCVGLGYIANQYVCGVRWKADVIFFPFTYGYPFIPAAFVEKTLLFHLDSFSDIIKNKMTI